MLFKVLAGVLVCPAACASALRSRVSALEEELQAKAATLRSVQSEVAQSKKELSAKELSIQRGRDELSMAHTRMAQESERVNTHTQHLYWKLSTLPFIFYLPRGFVLLHRMGVGLLFKHDRQSVLIITGCVKAQSAQQCS